MPENSEISLKVSPIIITFDKENSQTVLKVSDNQNKWHHRYPDGSNFLVLAFEILLIYTKWCQNLRMTLTFRDITNFLTLKQLMDYLNEL